MFTVAPLCPCNVWTNISNRGTRQGSLKGAKVACLLRKVAQAGVSCVGWSGARIGRTEWFSRLTTPRARGSRKAVLCSMAGWSGNA